MFCFEYMEEELETLQCPTIASNLISSPTQVFTLFIVQFQTRRGAIVQDSEGQNHYH